MRKYSQISKIDLVEIDEEVIKISKKFLKEIGGEAWNDKRLKIHIDDGVQWVKKTRDNFYDVIFIDCSDPSEFSNLLFSDSFYKECKRILTKNGILATQSESPESFKNIHISILKTLKKIFRVSPFLISITQKVVSFFQDSLNVAERLSFAEVTSSGESLDADMSKTYEILELKKEDMTSLESYIKEYYQQILKRLREMEADLNIEEKKRLPF